MSSQPLIRPEQIQDHQTIGEVISVAFSTMPYAAGDEAQLVERLRDLNALPVSLVAELEGHVIGHIAFSPAYPSEAQSGWFALGPVAVLPRYQRRGIGSMLVNSGMQAISEMHANGCILVGNPAYYARFGFKLTPANAPADQPAEYFMMKVLRGTQPAGAINFHPVFSSHA